LTVRFSEFERRAHQIFDGIPEDYREGVDALEVLREAMPHPSLPEIYTLGECRTETYPSEFGGPGDVRSMVVLFHGSFQRLSELDPDFSWEEELWETVTHEVQHHLESLALEDALEVRDWVEDQNFARREGEPFDPHFYRDGMRLEEGVFEVGGDVFVERALTPQAVSRRDPIRLEWEGRELELPLPEPVGDVHFVTVTDLQNAAGDLVVVLVRPRGLVAWMRDLFAGRRLEVLESEIESGSA
jgi:hypothetical protein